MQVFGFHVYNLYSFPSILNGNVNKCYELVSSEIFCLFPLQHDNSLICKMCRLCEMFSLIFVSLMRTPSTFIFQRIKLKTVYSVCGICRIVTHTGWCHSFPLNCFALRLPTNQIDASVKSRFILELKD